MLYLAITITLNSLLFVIFRIYAQIKINTFQAIVINYVVCSCIGIYFLKDYNHLVLLNPSQIWAQTGVILGVLFIFTFYLIGYTTQVCGITTTTVANKMSLVIPVYFSLYVFKDLINSIESTMLIGLLLALAAILFTSIKPTKGTKNKVPTLIAILLPLLVFLFGGAIDTLISYSKLHILTAGDDGVFTTLIFLVAAVIGIIILVGKIIFIKEGLDWKSMLWGVALGVPNYFSIFYLVKTIGHFNNNAAFAYPIINMGIILFSGLLSVLFFKEKLTPLNKIGMLMSFVALLLIAHKEILPFFIPTQP